MKRIIIATAALVMLATACSGGNPSSAGSGGSATTAGSASSPSAVAYSHCMRSRGVPNFPDPGSNGVVPKADSQQLGVSSSELQAAQRDCQALYPSTGGSFQQQAQQCYVAGDCPPAIVQQVLTQLRKFARCMRSHGVPNWPDPLADSQGQAYFDTSAQGIPRHSPQIDAKTQECSRVMNPDVPWGEQ
jgi:hypothetical protein